MWVPHAQWKKYRLRNIKCNESAKKSLDCAWQMSLFTLSNK